MSIPLSSTSPMTRLEMYQYLERQKQEINDAEAELAEKEARLDRKKRELAERRRVHHNTVLSQLGYICTELPEERPRTRTRKSA